MRLESSKLTANAPAELLGGSLDLHLRLTWFCLARARS
jgi:hypothetical protein